MQFLKRFGWFFAVNILIIATISIVTSVLGLNRYMTAYGINYTALAIYCLIWGFSGAFISLALSRIMAKFSMGVQLIDPQTATGYEKELLTSVYQYAQKAGISTMPQVGIYDSPEMNAFATGPTRNRSLVAVSTGLLRSMSKKEVEGVLAHEVAHIANGDMVTMTLIQGVVNAFVMFIARIIGFAVSQSVKEENRPLVNMVVVLVCDILLGILGSVAVAWFSRLREFRADAGAAQMGGSANMIAALERLNRGYDSMEADSAPQSVAAFRISNKRGGLLAAFSTHPPLEERIARLKSQSGF
ncbi:MAG: protease HtpX [Proteobacteria bacterium]|nr:protease HtpX [Pseudomonadota bacterium]